MRVLVVDDSPTIRRVVGSVLQRAGHEVATAESAIDGLRELLAFQPDIVLLDLIMPNMNGYQLLKKLVSDHADEIDDVPFVLMCTRGDQVPAVDQTLKAMGVVDVITKPFSPEALLAVVNHSLEKHGRRAAVRDTTRVVQALASIAPAEKDERSDDSDLYKKSFDVDEATATERNSVMRTRPSNVAPSVVAPPPAKKESPTQQKLHVPHGIALCGDLTVVALPEVLQLLKFQGQTGLLLVDAGGLRFEMSLEQGAVIAMHARAPDGGPARRGDLLLGRYFVSAGLVDDATLEGFLAAKKGKPIGEVLVAAGVVSPDELRRAVGEQTQDLMVELLRNRRGVFFLQAGAEHLPTTVARPGWNVDVLLFEALRQIDEWGVIESEVPSFEARFALRLSSTGALDDSGLSAEEGAVLRQLKAGPLAVRELVKRSPLRPFDVCRLLYRLAVLKRVRRIDDGDSSRLVSEENGPQVPVLSLPPREVT